jgi:hypothetical protein
MAKKQFKIGECAVGGIISVDITGKVIQIKALDYFTKETVSSGSAMLDDNNCSLKIEEYLTDLTTCYHAGKIMEWIKKKSKDLDIS